jgi:glycine oxidase
MTAAPEPVLILGGGLIGLAIAHQLVRRGASVLVLSRRRSEAADLICPEPATAEPARVTTT